MRLILLTFLLMVCAQVGWAAPLSREDCAEILERYQIVADGCGDAEASTAAYAQAEPESVQSVQGQLSQTQMQDHIFFAAGGVRVSDAARLQIHVLAEVLETKALRQTCIQLIGHSDSSGSDARNLEVGQNRAETVQVLLAALISSPERIASVMSRGEIAPLPNLVPEDPNQRRVEVRLKYCPEFLEG